MTNLKPDQIAYKKGYKYQLVEDHEIQTEITGIHIDTDYIKLFKDGRLVIIKGYAWDGPSGPTIDTKNFMRGSLIHDALYQLMRQGFLQQAYRNYADKLLRKICKEKGMCCIRAAWVYYGVDLAGKRAADPAHKKKIYIA